MESQFDVVVIGGGPAGASAALWLKMLGFQPLVVEARSQLGGLQIINPYANEWIVTSPFATGGMVANAIRRSVVDEHRIDTWLDSRVVSVTGTDGAFVTRVQSGPLGREAVSRLKVAILGGGDNATENYAYVKARGAAVVAKDVSP